MGGKSDKMRSKIGDFDSERDRLLQEARKLISDVQGAVGVEQIDNLEKAVDTLWELRRVCYEPLNQIQHDVMILQAAEWIESNYYREKNIEWWWNPRQTGSKLVGSQEEKEPDLRGKVARRTVVSAEITTSAKPIYKTMAETLEKLSVMRVPGKKIYFVHTEEMELRAKNRVSRQRYKHIEVRRI
jgi:hypothetical protein